jgi:hypothetical protein
MESCAWGGIQVGASEPAQNVVALNTVCLVVTFAGIKGREKKTAILDADSVTKYGWSRNFPLGAVILSTSTHHFLLFTLNRNRPRVQHERP